MKEATYYETISDGKIQCFLCPHHCIIPEGKTGICRVRKNLGGKLWAETYGKISSLHADPMEKKPLYHFFPGKKILSVGSVGCTMNCVFCQNCEISQTGVEDFPFLRNVSPRELAMLAAQSDLNTGLAYTYNEPYVSYEMIMETAPLIRAQNQFNVMVTNGFMEEKPFLDLLPLMDAFNVDLKGFTENFYRKYTHARLNPVLNTLKLIRKSSAHLEITHLVIPGLNDDAVVFRKMIEWIQQELGPQTILHLSRYFPRYKLTNPPTPVETLRNFFEIAKEYLYFVYIGNVEISSASNTYCPKCGTLLIERTGYRVHVQSLNEDGSCSVCDEKLQIRIH